MEEKRTRAEETFSTSTSQNVRGFRQGVDTAKLLRQVFFMMIKMKIHVLDVDVCLAHTGTKQASKIYVDHVCSKGRAELRFVATVTTGGRHGICQKFYTPRFSG